MKRIEFMWSQKFILKSDVKNIPYDLQGLVEPIYSPKMPALFVDGRRRAIGGRSLHRYNLIEPIRTKDGR